MAVAEESRGAEHARPWIDQARSQRVELLAVDRYRSSPERSLQSRERAAGDLDRRAEVASCGRPRLRARPIHFRRMDLKTRTMSPEDQAASGSPPAQAYLDAVRAWVNTGKHALPSRCSARRAAQGDAGDRRGPCPIQTGCVAARPWRSGRGRPADEHSECTSSRFHGVCGARPPISTRSARRRAPTSGNACKRLGDRPYYPPPQALVRWGRVTQ